MTKTDGSFRSFTLREKEWEKKWKKSLVKKIKKIKNLKNTLRKTEESNVTKAQKEECLKDGIVNVLPYCRKLH